MDQAVPINRLTRTLDIEHMSRRRRRRTLQRRRRHIHFPFCDGQTLAEKTNHPVPTAKENNLTVTESNFRTRPVRSVVYQQIRV